MGQIMNGMAKGERTYSLKTQSRYDGSDCKWYEERRRDIQAKGCRASTMGQIMNDMERGGGTHILKVQSKYDGQIANGMAMGERTYSLKMRSGYDESDREWHGKGRKGILAGSAEWVRRVRSRMAWQKEK